MTKKIPLKLLDRSILAVEASRSRLDPWTLFSLVVCANNKILIPLSRLAMQNHLPANTPPRHRVNAMGAEPDYIVRQDCSPRVVSGLFAKPSPGESVKFAHHRAIHVLPSTFGTLFPSLHSID